MSRRHNARDYSTTSSTSDSSDTYSTSESEQEEERRYMRAVANLDEYASAVADTQMTHEKNSLAGISLEGIFSSGSVTTTATTSKNLAPLDVALTRMNDYVQRFESHQPMGTLVNTAQSSSASTLASPTTTTATTLKTGLVHASELSPQQLAQVHRNTESALQKRIEFVEISQLPVEKQAQLHARQSPLKSVHSLGASQQQQVKLNAQKSERADLKQVPMFDNSASILKQKASFDLSFSASVTDANLRTIFEGKPLECPTSAQHQAQGSLILAHLHKHHRHFCDLIHRGDLKMYMCDVVHRTGLDYLMLIPTRRYLEALGLDAKKTSAIKIVGSHLALFDRKSKAPVLHNMSDRTLYEYPSALFGHRIVLRRLDDETIEVNGAWLAVRDSVGGGHLYVMKDVSPRQLVAEERRAQNRNQQQMLTEEPRLIDLDDEPDVNLAYTTVEETLSARPTELMQPVGHIGSYREPKMSVLLSKMLQPQYNSKQDMKSYLPTKSSFFLSNNTNAATTTTTQCVDLHVKLFDLHDAFNRHLANALNPLEYMRPVSACVISGTQAQALELGESLCMHEYKVGAQESPLRKSDFLNHVAVLSFVRGDDVLMTSFAVNDEPYSKDVYMSPSEGVVLRFKDNLLDCVALNPISQAFSAQAHEGDSVGVNQSVSLRLAVDKPLSTKLEAHEHTFEQFAELVVPLCAPSFVKRAKAALKGALTHSITLTPVSEPLSTENDEPEGPEATKRIMAMIGKNAALAAKNKHSYTTQRQTYHSRARPSDYIDIFTFEKPLSFTGLVDKKGRPLVLSLTVPNPITQKPQTLVFKLSNTKNIANTSGWTGAKAGLVFHFEMQGGAVERMGIEYQKAAAGGSGRRSAKLPEPMVVPEKRISASTKEVGGGDITAFLIDEAYKLHSLSLPVAHAYLKARLQSLLAGVQLSDGSSAQRFFQSMQESLKAHPLDAPSQGVDSLLSMSLSEVQSSVMSKNCYVMPVSATVEKCSALFEHTNFSKLNGNAALQKALDFATEKAMSAPDRQIYVSRLACILQEVLTVLKK